MTCPFYRRFSMALKTNTTITRMMDSPDYAPE